jgi:hypothetical protein
MIELPFQKFWKIMLGEIMVSSWIHFFNFLFLYKGFIIENFNLLGKIPLVRTLLPV